ncbi:unnamed protein product [Sphenostylis stenocarpa]|uniref:Uncharacterized protein n=1 Tax=Sphenostylis stenocarpa TaxID=92480 RepID=A0AA86RQ42_9FABA|nr:unnamed protein product [Sphenostylis stenocarpa]
MDEVHPSILSFIPEAYADKVRHCCFALGFGSNVEPGQLVPSWIRAKLDENGVLMRSEGGPSGTDHGAQKFQAVDMDLVLPD